MCREKLVRNYILMDLYGTLYNVSNEGDPCESLQDYYGDLIFSTGYNVIFFINEFEKKGLSIDFFKLEIMLQEIVSNIKQIDNYGGHQVTFIPNWKLVYEKCAKIISKLQIEDIMKFRNDEKSKKNRPFTKLQEKLKKLKLQCSVNNNDEEQCNIEIINSGKLNLYTRKKNENEYMISLNNELTLDSAKEISLLFVYYLKKYYNLSFIDIVEYNISN